ncbi:terminal uridylyltransferase 4 isoform X1 [Gadus chalcogrammus]|uniref:terminal uridylyltransferase 4 isoform X1 n=2 Tax=Gadus chalcogrammus TaxID=1042646 RepID=UPI0024C4886E|nr:terminal uridylyltransferase 4 isoform X1 [Gadus chalcogrammus]
MDESTSGSKTVKPSRTPVRAGPRGPMATKPIINNSSNKEPQPPRDVTKSAGRSNNDPSKATRESHSAGNQGGYGGLGRGNTDSHQDKGRGRPRRLTGRTSSGDRGKGKAPGQQQQQQQQQLPGQVTHPSAPLSASRGPPGGGRESGSSSSVVLCATERGIPEQARANQGKASQGESIEKGSEVGAVMVDGKLTEQQLGLQQAEERLYRDYIHRLVKQSPEYPNFQYLCKLCSVHIENIQGAHKHIKEKRHKKNIMEKQEENELRALPPPSEAQLWAVDAAVLEAARVQGISEEDFQQRQAVVSRMEETIQQHLTACSLRLYGSCLTRFAFKTSDVNIDVAYPATMTQPDVLIQVLEILKKSPQFLEVESDFHAKVPVVFCRDTSSGLACKVSAGNDLACLTTNHLATLARLEPRLVPLVLAFRYWAQLCHIDCQAEGGIPSYSFALMVIFFLQQRRKPILPVYLGHWIEGFTAKRVDEFHLTGISLDVFVRWEHRTPSTTEGRGEHRGEHRVEGKPKPEQTKADGEGLTRLTMGGGEGQSLGQLWLELLRFYTLEFALEDYIISIRLKELLTREQKNWPRRRLAIEDPFAVKRNVARSLNSQMVFEYIQERFRTAYKYFACPQSLSTRGRQRGGKQAGRRPGAGGAQKPREEEAGKDGQRRMNEVEGEEEEEEGAGGSGRKKGDLLEGRLQDLGLSDGESPDKKRLSLAANGVLDSDSEEEEEEEDDEEEMEEEEENRVSQKNRLVLPEDLHYIFDRMIFTGGKPPTVVCSICKRDGHLKDECPEDFKKMELKPLPPMGDHFREILDGLCRLCYHELSPSLIDQQKREQILVGLERFIRKEYNDKALLCLFGSSKNGFGFRDSDLDICMTLEGHDTAERLNCKEIIEGLAKVLKKHTGLKNILPITTAKVPIVKFEHRQSLLEGDISLYNTLAQHNTRMLATYAAIDPRVTFLGYTMKVFAKRCDIGDASRGSLSSYAYILMVLYFLQQRQPPVIPVLQEIFDGSNVPECMVDGWNAFFFNDIEDLRRRLPELQQNKESVGELWLGLLRFYTEEFDFKEHVISIRQRKRLTTFEKQWTSKCIAIEDPFDLNHNLGAGVSRKMTNFIMKAFINGRKLFGTPFYPLSGTEADYFFDSKVLTDGELAPNDRCCRICGKIGHYMKDCPKRRRVKKKEGEKEEDVKEDEREPRERRCFQCGDMGHVRRDCPDYRHLRQRAPGGPAAHMVRNMVSSHSIPIPQSDRTARTRQSSECSDSRQTPPYSPQPTPFSQSPSPFSQSPAQPAGSPQTAQCKSNAGGPAKVPLPLFNFPAAHPAQFHPGAAATLSALGLLAPHPSQGPGHHPHPHPHPVHISPNSSWPIHGPVLPPAAAAASSTGPSPPGLNFPLRPSGNPKGPGVVGGGGGGVVGGGGCGHGAMNLNDPSIIFAQPAGRPLGLGGAGRDAHWQNHLAQPGALVGNGTVAKSEPGFQGQFGAGSQVSRSWEPSAGPHFSMSPSWPYRMPHGFLQQGNGAYQHSKAFQGPGSVGNPNQNFPMVQHVRHHVNLNFIQQKK